MPSIFTYDAILPSGRFPEKIEINNYYCLKVIYIKIYIYGNRN